MCFIYSHCPFLIKTELKKNSKLISFGFQLLVGQNNLFGRNMTSIFLYVLTF